MASSDGNKWKTAITSIQPNEVRLRGFRLDQLMGKVSFGQAVYLALRGEMPTQEAGELIEAILVACIDHGATPPSVLACRTSASTGAPLNAALCAGILSINRLHGGAIEDAMNFFYEHASSISDADVASRALEAAAALKNAGKKASGYGHRIHTDDPRTARLVAMARERGLAGKYVNFAVAFESGLAQVTGRKLPLNVDGAIAAVLCDLGFDSKLANAFFIMARVTGLTAHYFEETTREKPMRNVTPGAHEYDGPPPRDIS
ncbi:MAG: citryl-CoA lyase [Candidatus Brocadiia bacterium]